MNRLTLKTAFAAATLCAIYAPGSAAFAKTLTFGYVVANLKIPFNVATKRGFEDAARDAGVTAIVIDPQGSVDAQAKAVADLINQGVDGLGFLPMDSILAQTFADKSAAKKIPNVSVAVQVGDSATRDVRDVYPTLTALVTTDDVAIGERAGELAAGLLPKGQTAQIAILEGAKGYSAVTQRTAGFRTALDAAKIDYKIVSSQPTDWTPQEGKSACQIIIASNPEVNLIFSQADDMALGCSQALQIANSKAKLIATGGGSLEGNNAIEKGNMAGSVCTRPELLGRLMLKVLYEAATNPKAQKAQFVTYDSTIITSDTLKNCPPEW